MNVLCEKTSCLQVYLYENEIKRVEQYKVRNKRKSQSSAVRALMNKFFDDNIESKNHIEETHIIENGKRRVVQCYLEKEILNKINIYRIANFCSSDSECARIVILKTLDAEGIIV